LANDLLQRLNDIHQRLQTENNRTVLERLKEAYAQMQQPGLAPNRDTLLSALQNGSTTITEKLSTANRLQQYRQLIDEYELALKTSPKVLLVVENARPQPWADKPDIAQAVIFTLLASLLFAFLLAVFVESRNQKG